MLSKKMKLLVFFSYLVCVFAVPTPTTESNPLNFNQNVDLLHSKECTYGPTYWCKNITTAAGCKAVKHCIQTVWEHQILPPDHTSVCETCLEMVKEARDQLQSNETEEEIKEVFEGSCKLIPVKVVAEACIKVADEFIVELVDALASQMNPQIVCSIAGLCNNEQVHQLLDEMGVSATPVVLKRRPGTCKGCRTVIKLLEKKFHQSSRDYILENFLLICGRMGSLSDACSNIVVKYFNEIYLHLEENLNPDEFCLMSGECSSLFHNHISDVEVRPLSDVGVIRIEENGDDLPCDLCKQLVQHLRDILVANTTEAEFKKVLIGICKQTGSFKDECISMVNEYYAIAYDFLVNDLNGTVICAMVGICGKPSIDNGSPIIPLLPVEIVQSPLLSNSPSGGAVGSIQIIEPPKIMLLPIERIMPQTLTLMGNTELCTFCEYFLHFVQHAITDPKTEESIKMAVDRACDVLPKSVNATCRQFVDTYGPAFIAILAQEIDPSVVCPKLSLCPSLQAQNVEIFMHHVKGDKPNCPMCLLAMESLEELVKNKKTEDNLRQTLSNLCSHLHGTVEKECQDFVNSYTDQIVEAFLALLTPTEVCEYLRLCKDNTPPSTPPPPKIDYGGNTDTNEIPDSTANGKTVPSTAHSPVCVICEFVLSEIDKQLSDNSTEEEIKSAVIGICNYLPKSVNKQCLKFVDRYADLVIQLLLQELDPSSVCTNLHLCTESKKVQKPAIFEIMEPAVEENVGSPQCVLCKMVMTKIEQLLDGQISEDAILKAIHGVCQILPAEQSKDCNEFIDKYGPSILKLLEMAVQPSEICSLMMLCAPDLATTKYETHSCEVCEAAVLVIDQILQNPTVDHELEHVLEKTCRALPVKHQPLCRGIIELYGEKIFKMLSQAAKPNSVCTEIGLCARKELLGNNKCTWGPGYWCTNEESATMCGMMSHCQEKVWKNKRPIK